MAKYQVRILVGDAYPKITFVTVDADSEAEAVYRAYDAYLETKGYPTDALERIFVDHFGVRKVSE